MIKKCWIHEYEDDMFIIAFRQPPKSLFPLFFTNLVLPPIEEIDGKLLNLKQAEELNLQENHTVLRFLNREDLIKLRNAIDEVL